MVAEELCNGHGTRNGSAEAAFGAQQLRELRVALKRSPPEIPFSFLYDERGSELYEQITQLPEYYPFNEEDRLLKMHIESIISHIPPCAVVVELGCGTARKTAHILNALVARDGSVRFAGIDVSESFLEEARTNLLKHVPGLKTAQVTLVNEEYIEGLRKVREKFQSEMLCVLWLGSSVGNLDSEGAVTFFKDMNEAAGNQMQLLLCTDMWKGVRTLYAAYHDSEGVTEMFIKNGVRNAFRAIKYEASDSEEASWQYEVEVNPHLRRVEMWVRVRHGLSVPKEGVFIRPGERILMEVSRKFTPGDIGKLAQDSRFCIQAAWRSRKYGVQMLLPAVEALSRSWEDTDAFFATIPDWSAKPIDLRHPFCFYYGHVMAFAKIKLLPDEEPTAEELLFSRGIDPNVLDPSLCHSHPEAPETWPKKEDIIAFVERTRRAIMAGTKSGKITMNRINFALEHDRMHQETLCYMLVQDKRMAFEKAPPPSIVKPRIIKALTDMSVFEPDTIISPGEVTLGANVTEGGFLWDNEGPACGPIAVEAFSISSMPVSVGAFRTFILEKNGYERAEWWEDGDFQHFKERGQCMPATWSKIDGEFYVTSMEGTKHWSEVAETPVLTSLAEAQAITASMGCRIITEEEYQRAIDVVEGDDVLSLKEGGWEWTSTPFKPFPGFKALADYPEYSTDFFDGHHYTLKGASTVTHPSLYRDSFRNFFQRQYPFVFAKFRCCRSTSAAANGAQALEYSGS